MISLFNAQGDKIGSFRSFEDVMEYFNHREKLTIQNPNSPENQERWEFSYYSHRRLSPLNDHSTSHLTELEQEAYEQQLDLIEIFSGDSQYPEQFLVIPDLDLPELIKNWCFDYAYAHQLVLLQTICGSKHKNTASQYSSH